MRWLSRIESAKAIVAKRMPTWDKSASKRTERLIEVSPGSSSLGTQGI